MCPQVLNILTGFGPEAGTPLAGHRGVDKARAGVGAVASLGHLACHKGVHRRVEGGGLQPHCWEPVGPPLAAEALTRQAERGQRRDHTLGPSPRHPDWQHGGRLGQINRPLPPLPPRRPVSSPDLLALCPPRQVAFTGSTEVGREIGRLAAGNIKPCTLEVGTRAKRAQRHSALTPTL